MDLEQFTPKQIEYKDVSFCDSPDYNEDFGEGLPFFDFEVTVNYPCVQLKWFVEDMSEVYKGQHVCTVIERPFAVSKKEYKLFSPISGILLINIFKEDYYYLFEFHDYKLFSVYKDLDSIIKNRYLGFKESIEYDNFDKAVSLKWINVTNRVGYSGDSIMPFEYPAHEMTSDMGISMFVSFQIVSNVSYIVFSFNKKDVCLSEGDNIDLLLKGNNQDNKVLNFRITQLVSHEKYENLYDVSYFCRINDGEINELIDNDCTNWRIRFFRQPLMTIKGINSNDWCTISTSYIAFRGFADAFKVLINKLMKDYHLELDVPSMAENESCYVYLMLDVSNGYYKIGISNRPEYREKTLQSEKPTIEMICAKKYPNRSVASAIESALHKAYESKRLRGEWFTLDANDVNAIISTLS